jgi:uncharacterized OB-fold protein
MAEYLIQSAPANPETAAWWAAIQQQRLTVAHCVDCGHVHHYPRAICPYCFSGNVELIPASGEGVIYSVSAMRRGVPVPYAIAYVELDEGVTMLTHIIDAPLDDIRIGQRVAVRFRPSESGQLVPMFGPQLER